MGDKIKVSVCVPVRDEEGAISQLLEDLLQQTQPPDEIIITDGGSADATPRIIAEYIERGAPIRLLRERGAFPGRGRNLAAAQASFEWLAFIDAGVSPRRDWLARLAANVEQDKEIEVVYGAWEPDADSFFKECAAIAFAYAPAGTSEQTLVETRFIACSLVRRSVWRAVGGFPEHLRSAEDIIFMRRVDAAGFPVAYEPQAVVRWSMPPTLWRTFKRFVIYSRHNLRAGLWKEWQAAIFIRYTLLLAGALAALTVTRRWLLSTTALWLCLLGARALTALWRNREVYPARAGRGLLRLSLLVPLIAALDVATILGTLDWVVRDRLGRAGGASRAAKG